MNDDSDPPRHVIKYTHDDGVERDQPLVWCGERLWRNQWMFLDAQHCLLALDQSTLTTPCPKCLEAMRGVIDRELEDA